MSVTREKDGRIWPIGDAQNVQWINDGIARDRTITSAIPPVFDAYATLVLPLNLAEETQAAHEAAVIALLARHSRGQTWWLGYLDTSPVTNVVFHDAPRVKLYANWDYVLVEAGPQQAAAWRAERPEFKGPLPDLIFPADRSWLFSTLWDDDWSCIGGSEQLIADFENDPAFKLPLDPGPRLARVGLGDDATPDGHQSY